MGPAGVVPDLLRAARKARKGKTSRADVQAFEFDAERELLRLRPSAWFPMK